MYWKGGYQDKDQAISATTTKLKGIALTNSTQLNITMHGGVDGNRIWDVADYVMPPQVISSATYNSLYIMSSFGFCVVMQWSYSGEV